MANRRTRKQWQQLVVLWRRGGKTSGEFAQANGVLDARLRWWAWRLERDGDLGPAVGLVPVRVIEGDDGAGSGECVEGSGPGRLAWRLRTPRGELSVYASLDEELHAVVAALLDGGS